MRSGFYYKDRHSSEFGVTVRTKSRPILPAMKRFTQDMPYRDGEYDFSGANPHSREHYYGRTFAVSLAVTADNLALLQGKISKMSIWLCGRGKLIFDDMPLIVWDAVISDEVIYMPERGGKCAVLEVSFRAEPFGECIFGTDGPTLDMPVRLDDMIPIGLEVLYTYTVTGTGSVDVINFGDRPVRPVIKIDGAKGDVTLTLGGGSISFKGEKRVAVDFDKQTVTGDTGDIMAEGAFFEFPEGLSRLKISTDSQNKLDVTVSFTPEYVYDADFSEDRWNA